MTEAAAGKTTLIHSPDDVIAPFLAGNDVNKAGIELELTFLRPDARGRLRPIGNEENKTLQKILLHPQRYGFDFAPVATSEEAATMTLEIKTGAAGLDGMEDILRDLDRQLAAVRSVAGALGYVICPFAQVPHISCDDLQNLVVARESNRSAAFIAAFDRNRLDGYYRNFFLNNAVQVSVSYRDPEHLYDNVRRLAFLTAPLSNAHDNAPGFLEGAPDPRQTGLRLREGLAQDGRGGLPDFFLTARDGEDFIRSYMGWVFANKLLARYDIDGLNLAPAPLEDKQSLNDMIARGQGLNNQTNFELAFGMVWPHVKLAYIRGDNGAVNGVRYEARACDAGGWRNASFPLIVAALALDTDYAARTDALLSDYGFARDGGDDALALSRAAIDAALDYRDEFGTGRTSDFLQRFGALTDEVFRDRPALHERLTPFLAVCESGLMPGRERRTACPHLADAIALCRDEPGEAGSADTGTNAENTLRARFFPA